MPFFKDEILRDVIASRPVTGPTTGALFFSTDTLAAYRWSGTTWDPVTAKDLVTTQTANTVLSGPTTGGAAVPTYRALVAADIPAIAESGVTSLVADLALKAPLISPALVTPDLGTPSAGVLTHATGLLLTTGVTGNLPVTNLDSGTSASSTTFWRGDGSWAVPAGTAAVPSFADNETPSGTVNGSNTAFTVAHTPNPAASLQIFINGILQAVSTDYTLATAIVTFTNAPSTGEIIRAFYRY